LSIGIHCLPDLKSSFAPHKEEKRRTREPVLESGKSPFINLSMAAKISVLVGDITQQKVDAVANAANRELTGGAGVNGAIHKAGGPEIYRFCDKLRETKYPNGLPPGQSAITPGGKLTAKWIIHTVGPMYGQHGGKEAELLASCYRTSLELAESRKLESIAFPAMSTGIYGYPAEQAAKVATRAVQNALQGLKSIQEIRFVFFSERDLKIFKKNSVLEA
jgi:O-acetyl-ADP-ribose deacetylase (regulator of RNase III)